MDTSFITDYDIKKSETTDHTMASTLVDQSKALGNDLLPIEYHSADFRLYFDRMLDSYDEFIKIYTMLLLKANGRYDNFPDGNSYTIDFNNMEHAIGISSFGFNDNIAIDFMNDLLSLIQINPPSGSIKDQYKIDENNIIDIIINIWDSSKRLSDKGIMDAIKMIQKYKDVDDAIILGKIEKLATIILEISFSNKRRNQIKYISNGKRNKEIINDLMGYIDNELSREERRILFSMDFRKYHTYEETTVQGMTRSVTKYIDQSDEKQFVLGKISRYLISKYDRDIRNNKHGFDIFQLITQTKEEYYKHYTEKLILRNLSKNPKSIKKSIKSFIDDNAPKEEQFKKVVGKFLNNESKIQLSRNNINYYLTLINKDGLNIEKMIFLYNLGITIPQLIADNKKELDDLLQKELELEGQIKEIKKKLEASYKNSPTEKTSFETYINNVLKGIIKKDANPLENELNEINKELSITHTKLISSEEYQEKLEAYKDKVSRYPEIIESNIKELLRDYSLGTINIFDNNNSFIKEFILELLRSNYLPIVIDKIDKINQNPPIINSETGPILEIMEEESTKKMRMQTIEFGELKRIAKQAKDRIKEISDKKNPTKEEHEEANLLNQNLNTLIELGYKESENDVDFAINLVAKIKDRRMINIAHNKMQNQRTSTSNDRIKIGNILKAFKTNQDNTSIVSLVHALLHNKDVQDLLERRFNNKEGTEFNYDKIAYKCLSLLPLSEIIDTKIPISNTIDNYNLKAVDSTLHADINKQLSDINKHSPFIMYLGGDGEIKTLVYLEAKKSKGMIYLVPVHSIKYEVKGKLKYEMTPLEVLNGKYMPLKRIDGPSGSVVIDSGTPVTISRRI